MIKDTIAQNENTQANSIDLAKLKADFPQCFDKLGNFDISIFKSLVSSEVNVKDEGYELRFLGKNYARLLAAMDTTTVIEPNVEHNSKPENKNSHNIYITGDNLDALKHLLHSYSQKIKCIYIDPPYNTGSDGFVYSDNFNFTKETLMEKLGISLEDAEKMLNFTKHSSSSHSAWLMFMYPRLTLARDLLTEDGTIFISCDDNEHRQLLLICDFLFGEENFKGSISILSNPRGRDYGGIARCNEYLVVYGKSSESQLNLITDEDQEFTQFDEIGGFETRELRNRNVKFNKDNRPNLFYPFYINTENKDENNLYEISLTPQDGFLELYPKISQGVQTVWRWGKQKSQENLNINIKAKAMRDGGYQIVEKYREPKFMARSIWNDKDVNTEKGTLLVKKLFDGQKVFDYPKPIQMIERIIEMGTFDEDIVLDFFSGSASTAHAVMDFNHRYSQNLKYIMVQIPALTPENSVAAQNGYKTIDEIGRERITKAANLIKTESPNTTTDLGFKHYILRDFDDNFIENLDVLYNEAVAGQQVLIKEPNQALDKFGVDAVLNTYLVHDGYGFSPEVTELDLSGYKGYKCGKHLYLLYEGFTADAMKSLYEHYANEGSFSIEHIVLFGYSFTYTETQMLKDNLDKIKDTEGINRTVNLDIRY